MKEFKRKVTVVIGAAGGIGLAHAVRCSQERMDIVLANMEEQALMPARK